MHPGAKPCLQQLVLTGEDAVAAQGASTILSLWMGWRRELRDACGTQRL
jgi:hypothetical protein